MPWTRRVILGSRSPRRLELLRQILPADCIEVLPPLSEQEAGFDNLHDMEAIQDRVLQIAHDKCADVLRQLANRRAVNHTASDGTPGASPIVVTADTVVIVQDSGGASHVLGKPPEDASWPAVVRRWFREYYAGRFHTVATAFCVANSGGPPISQVVTTEVAFSDDVERWLDWYVATGEPRGKAGGYALQGAGSLFVSRVEGSISNVVGLPVRELMDVLRPSKLLP